MSTDPKQFRLPGNIDVALPDPQGGAAASVTIRALDAETVLGVLKGIPGGEPGAGASTADTLAVLESARELAKLAIVAPEFSWDGADPEKADWRAVTLNNRGAIANAILTLAGVVPASDGRRFPDERSGDGNGGAPADAGPAAAGNQP